MAKPTVRLVANTMRHELWKTERRLSAASPAMDANAMVPDITPTRSIPSTDGCHPGDTFTKKVRTPAQAATPHAPHQNAKARCRYQVYGIKKMFTDELPGTHKGFG